MREPQCVAKRALILGGIAFRSSLEVTEHPRSAEIARKILPWLDEIGCEEEVDPFERELLLTPQGQLSDSQMSDANWAGEAAMFFCWTLRLAEPLDAIGPVDPSGIPALLSILHPAAVAIVQSAALRESAEIENACRHFVLIRSLLQETRIGLPASDIIRRLNLKMLNEVGLAVPEHAVKRASETVTRMTPDERSRAAGVFFVRMHAALWLFSNRPNYFALD